MCEAHAMSGAALWTYFARELMSSRRFSSKDKCKWFSFTAFTRYQPPPGTLPKSHSEVLKYTKGYTALGKQILATLYKISVLLQMAFNYYLADIDNCYFIKRQSPSFRI